jgi:hypothetical protein
MRKPGPKKDSRRHAYGDDKKRNAMLTAGAVAGGGGLSAAYISAAHTGQRKDYAEKSMAKAYNEGMAKAKAWQGTPENPGDYISDPDFVEGNTKNPHSGTKSQKEAEKKLSKKLDMTLKRRDGGAKPKWEPNSGLRKLASGVFGRGARVPWRLKL